VVKDLGIAARQMSLEAQEKEEEAHRQKERERRAEEAKKKPAQSAVMVVESNSRMQDLFRDRLKRAGYRVLLTSDPERAVERFRQDVKTADCIVLNAQEIGRSALAAFNTFGEDASIASVPAVLLVDENQQHLAEEASKAEHRVVLSMPVTMKQFRATLSQLIPSPSGTAKPG
jgi:serine/threonine-protein kinase